MNSPITTKKIELILQKLPKKEISRLKQFHRRIPPNI